MLETGNITNSLPASGRDVAAFDVSGSRSASDQLSKAKSENTGDYYSSPVLKLDTESLRLVFQVRDAATGDVTTQYPSEKALKAYQDAEADQET